MAIVGKSGCGFVMCGCWQEKNASWMPTGGVVNYAVDKAEGQFTGGAMTKSEIFDGFRIPEPHMIHQALNRSVTL